MTFIPVPRSLVEAETLDAADPLRTVRDRFVLPDGLIYLDGHSLGPATRVSLAHLERTARTHWAQGLIRSWNDAGWIDLPHRLGGRLARWLGVPATSVLVCDSVSVNLFKLAAAALPLARTQRLLVESDEFPTDQYIADGLGRLTGAPVQRLDPDAGLEALSSGGVLIKSAVNYRSAGIADIAAHESAARAGGGLIIWDLSHAVGVVDLNLTRDGAQLATGCTYKHLNGGPGAPAFLVVAPQVADRLESPISGWFGHATPFAFDSVYAPKPGVDRFAAGTPGVLSAAALEGALEAMEDVDVIAMASKAQALGELLLARADQMGLASPTPRNPSRRGGHVSLLHPDGYAIVQALIEGGVIADFRAPDAMRFAVSPAFLGYADIWRACDRLEQILSSGIYRDPRYAVRAAVT